MDTRYNVYYAGEVLEGHDPDTVRANLAKLFSADDQTLDKLFSGKVQLLKRECEEPLAHKYRDAMIRAGAQPIIRALEAGDEAPAPPVQPAQARSAAEKIAALAAEPDDTRYQAEAAPGTAPPAAAPSDSGTDQDHDHDLDLAPEGTEVLREHERPAPVEADIDTSALAVDAAAERLSEEPPPPPPAPDTGHLAMGEVGETIPGLPGEAPVDPDTSGLDLDPPGTGFEDCAAPEAETPDLDLTGLDVAPEGSEVLEEQYRKREEGQPPATDHLSVEE